MEIHISVRVIMIIISKKEKHGQKIFLLRSKREKRRSASKTENKKINLERI